MLLWQQKLEWLQLFQSSSGHIKLSTIYNKNNGIHLSCIYKVPASIPGHTISRTDVKFHYILWHTMLPEFNYYFILLNNMTSKCTHIHLNSCNGWYEQQSLTLWTLFPQHCQTAIFSSDIIVYKYLLSHESISNEVMYIYILKQIN